MSEFMVLTAVEFALMFYVYSAIIGPRGFRNTSLLRQNPNLKWCFAIRRYCTPIVFSLNSCLAILFTEGIPTIADGLILNGVVVMISLLIGALVSEALVQKLKSMGWRRDLG